MWVFFGEFVKPYRKKQVNHVQKHVCKYIRQILFSALINQLIITKSFFTTCCSILFTVAMLKGVIVKNLGQSSVKNLQQSKKLNNFSQSSSISAKAKFFICSFTRQQRASEVKAASSLNFAK